MMSLSSEGDNGGNWERLRQQHPAIELVEDAPKDSKELDCFQKFVRDCGYDGFIAIDGIKNDKD